MVGEDHHLTLGNVPPDEALALLSHELRAEILWTLSRDRDAAGPPPIRSFSELRHQAAPDLDSGKFNYHLKQLEGTFIEKVSPAEGDEGAQVVPSMAEPSTEGYRLRPEGTVIIRTIRSFATVESGTIESIELDQECYLPSRRESRRLQ